MCGDVRCYTVRSSALLVHYHRQHCFTLSCYKEFLAYSSKPKNHSVLTSTSPQVTTLTLDKSNFMLILSKRPYCVAGGTNNAKI